MKTTPLTKVHESLKARMVDFGGFYMPVQYTSIIEEHKAVRNGAGIFDVSHMGEITVKGKQATEYLNNLVTNDITSISDNRIIYSPMCYRNGTVVDDILIYRINENYYLVIANASNTDKDFAWMQKNKGSFDVQIENESEKYGQVALQGPLAQQMLQKLTDVNLDDISFFRFSDNVNMCGVPALVSRTGYTGEDGFEIYTKASDIEMIFNKLIEQGAVPCGLGARDTLRFESALPLYGHELSDKIDPLSAGLKMFVKIDKQGFIGKEALVSILEKGIKNKIAGIEMVDRGIPRNGYEVYSEENELIGHVTSGSFCPSLDKTCALALIDSDFAKSGTTVYIDIRGRRLKAVTVKKPFYNKKYRK